jgi:hypothetical protein
MASDPPALPRAGFMAAVDRLKALLAKARAAVPDGAAERVSALLDKAHAALRTRAEQTPGQRPLWFLPLVTVGGLAVGVGLVALLFSLGGHKKDREAASVPVLASSPCTVAGAAHVIAPVALVAAGIEARAFVDGIALGFAPGDHEATAVRLDLNTLAATGRASARSAEPIRRVRPVLGAKDTLGLAVDADAQGDRVHGRRTLPLDPPLQAGAVGRDLVWTRQGGPSVGTLWSLDPTLEDLDALRGASEASPAETTTAIAFRRGNAIWLGVATGSEALAPKGTLSRIEGIGTTIGSPAVALDDGVVMIAWADRPSSDAPWRLRIAHGRAGDAPGEPVSFAPPPGGPGGHVMSPGLTALPGGRFFLVWTEGPTSQQRVRGLTLTLSGEPLGPPLEISNEGINSGQAQVAVTGAPRARGVVAFLASTEDGFEVAATPIACGP